ncbi:hypothetical protein ACWDPP_19895, partial [Streptomyces sp. NPDC000851]
MTDKTAPRTTGAVAAGLATIAADGTVLDTWFPAPELTAEPGPAAASPGRRRSPTHHSGRWPSCCNDTTSAVRL